MSELAEEGARARGRNGRRAAGGLLERTNGREPSTGRGAATRDRILAAARSTFEARGYPATRVSDVVAAAGVAHGTFYKYFDSKDDVFRELTNRVVTAMFERSRARYRGSDPVTRIRRANQRYLRVYRRDARFLAIVWQVAMFDRDYREFWLKLRQVWAGTIERWVERELAAGAADGRLDARVAARALGLMTESFAHEWFVLGEEYDEEVAVETLTRLWLNALGLAPAVRSSG